MSYPISNFERLKQLWRSIRRLMQNKLIRQLVYIAIVLISVAFIAYAIISNWTQLKNQEWHIEPLYVVLAVVLYPIGMLPASAAWHWLLKAFGLDLPFSKNLRIYALSSLPQHIPGFVWYITSRSLMYDEIGVSASAVVGVTLAETVLLSLSGFITAITVFALGSGVLEKFSVLRYLSVGSVIVLLALLIWAPGGTRLLDKLVKRIRNDAQAIQIQRSKLTISLIWMFVAWSGGGVLLWILCKGLTQVNWQLLPMMVGIWGAAGAVSLSIGIGIQGLGLREVTLGAILSTFISPLTAIVVVVAFRLALTIGEFLWVFIISILLKGKPTDPGLHSLK